MAMAAGRGGSDGDLFLVNRAGLLQRASEDAAAEKNGGVAATLLGGAALIDVCAASSARPRLLPRSSPVRCCVCAAVRTLLDALALDRATAPLDAVDDARTTMAVGVRVLGEHDVAAAVPMPLLPTIAGWLLGYPVLYCLLSSSSSGGVGLAESSEGAAVSPSLPAAVGESSAAGELSAAAPRADGHDSWSGGSGSEEDGDTGAAMMRNNLGMATLTVWQLSVVCRGLRVTHSPPHHAVQQQDQCDCVGGCRVPVMQFSMPTALWPACADVLTGALAALDKALQQKLSAKTAGQAFLRPAWVKSSATLPLVAL